MTLVKFSSTRCKNKKQLVLSTFLASTVSVQTQLTTSSHPTSEKRPKILTERMSAVSRQTAGKVFWMHDSSMLTFLNSRQSALGSLVGTSLLASGRAIDDNTTRVITGLCFNMRTIHQSQSRRTPWPFMVLVVIEGHTFISDIIHQAMVCRSNQLLDVIIPGGMMTSQRSPMTQVKWLRRDIFFSLPQFQCQLVVRQGQLVARQ